VPRLAKPFSDVDLAGAIAGVAGGSERGRPIG
jgi:hypothetical protein